MGLYKDEEVLTKEQEQAAEAGRCPKCSGSMKQLVPEHDKTKGEFYCEPCHYSYSFFTR